MRALPGPPTTGRTTSSGRVGGGWSGGGGSGFDPQPGLWAIPVLVPVVTLGVAFLIDRASSLWVTATGHGQPTHLVTAVLWILGAIIAMAAVTLVGLLGWSRREPAATLPIVIHQPATCPAPEPRHVTVNVMVLNVDPDQPATPADPRQIVAAAPGPDVLEQILRATVSPSRGVTS